MDHLAAFTPHLRNVTLPNRATGQPRLLFVVNHAGFFVSHRLPIAVAALAAGFDVHVASPPSDAVPQIVATGARHHPIPLSRSGLHPVEELRTLWSLVRLYREIRPSVVHHVTSKPVLYGSAAARLVGVPAVVNAITGLGYVFTARDRSRLLRRVARLSYRALLGHKRQRVIFQNPEDHSAFVGSGLVAASDAVLIAGSGVDLTRFTPTAEPSSGSVVVLPGRMLADKGVREFVEAARILAGRGVPTRFVLAGPIDPDNPTAIAESEIIAWQNDGLVEWLGNRSDMPRVFADANIVCLPSYREGLPKALIEAAAAGRAVVTTDVPGCRDAIVANETGLLVEVRNAGALADAIERLIRDGKTRHAMGTAGRRLAERRFDVRDVVARTLALYREVIA